MCDECSVEREKKDLSAMINKAKKGNTAHGMQRISNEEGEGRKVVYERRRTTHATTAFISATAIVLPIHAWGPARNVKFAKAGFSSPETLAGSAPGKNRAGLNDSASGPHSSVQVLIMRIYEDNCDVNQRCRRSRWMDLG